MKRGFKIVSSKQDQGLHLPSRQLPMQLVTTLKLRKILFFHQFGKELLKDPLENPSAIKAKSL